MNLKNKIRYKIWKHLNKKLLKKGIIKKPEPIIIHQGTTEEKLQSCPELTDILCSAIAHPASGKIFIDENINMDLYNKLKKFGDVDTRSIHEKALATFLYNQDKYLRNKLPSEPTNRLFIITGTISLINALCYIKEMKGDFKDSVVVCGAYNPKFIEQTINILNLFDFERICFCKATDNVCDVCLYNNLYQFDEVCFVHPYPRIKEAVDTLYQSCRLIEISENIAFTPIFEKAGNKAVSLFYERAFSDKLDYPYSTTVPTQYMKAETFEECVQEVRKKLNLTIDIPDGKWVLVCAGSCISPESHKNVVHSLLNKGFKVLFKPHPRVLLSEYQLKETTDLKIFNTTYALEYYDLSKIIGVVSWTSLALHTLTNLGVPCFSVTPNEESYLTNNFYQREMFLAQNYILPFSELMEVDISQSENTIRKNLLHKQREWLTEKPSLSQNKEFQNLFPYPNRKDRK